MFAFGRFIANTYTFDFYVTPVLMWRSSVEETFCLIFGE